MVQISQNPRYTVRRMCRLTLWVAALCYAVGSFLLSPLYIRFASDIAYADAWWVYVLYYLTEEGLLDLAAFSVCYTASLYAVWCAGLKKAIRVPVAFALITMGKFVVNFFMTAITDSALPDMGEFLSFDLPYIGALYLLEMLQYAVIIGIALWVKRVYTRKREYLEACATLAGKTAEPEAPMLPFDRLLSWKNPLQRSALFMALVVFCLRFSTHMIYQITLFLNTGISDGWLVMVLDLISDVFIGVIFYFVAMLLINRFYGKDSMSGEQG
jgi:hypothetical protein